MEDISTRHSNSNSNGAASSTSCKDSFSSAVRLRPVPRAQTMGDTTNPSTPIMKHRRGSQITTDSQGERTSIRSSVDDLLLPKSTTNDYELGSSHFHSTPLLFAVLPALGGILFEGGSVILTDFSIIALACIFLNWSLRLPWDWYQSSQVFNIEEQFADEETQTSDDTIVEEDEDGTGKINAKPKENKESPKEPRRVYDARHKSAVTELNRYQLLALGFCFAGPMLGAWLLQSIRERLSRPSEGLVSNFNLGIFILAAELRPTQHVFKLVQARMLYLQRTAAKNPHATGDVDPVAVEDIKARLSELETHVVSKVEETSTQEKQATVSTAFIELRKAIQPELDALNRAVRRYEKRAIALEMQVRGELQDHDQRIKDALALAAAVTRQKKGSFVTLLDFFAAIVVLPVQAVVMSLSAMIELPKTVVSGAYDALERTLGGQPAWLFPKRISIKRREREGNVRKKRRE